VRLCLRSAATNCSSPGWHVWRVMMMMMMMMPAGDNSTRALWQSYQQTSGASRRNGRKSENFAYQYLKYIKGSLKCRKILRHGISGFTSHPKEGVLRIFIALKNPSPRPDLNSRPLGPVASTLTTTPPRRHYIPLVLCPLVLWFGTDVY
jgi:hypothetical protein